MLCIRHELTHFMPLSIVWGTTLKCGCSLAVKAHLNEFGCAMHGIEQVVHFFCNITIFTASFGSCLVITAVFIAEEVVLLNT